MRTFIFFFIFLFTLVSPATSRFSSVIHHHTATTVFDPALSCVCIPDSSENDAAKVFSCISITFSVVYHGHDATTILASSAACYGSTDSTVYHASKVFIGSFPFFPDHLSDGLPQFMELVSSRVHFEMVYGFSFISSFISSFPFHSDLLSDQRNHTIPADQMRRTMPLMLRDGGNLEVIDFAKG
uniref:Transmembrane protein n=1 Tax=Medicago truncatula TaxID=3880 RepID=A2Q226_MEDTR|nr:hypothetical protein MtrDRAFT_AC149207g37v2 [Medicago truncatula]